MTAIIARSAREIFQDTRNNPKLKTAVESPLKRKGGALSNFVHLEYMYIHLVHYERFQDTKTTLHVRQLPPDFAGLDPTL